MPVALGFALFTLGAPLGLVNFVAVGVGASIISARPMTADRGMPPASDLAIAMMSGCTPMVSWPHILPVRPNPQITSSQIRRMPYLRQIASTCGQ